MKHQVHIVIASLTVLLVASNGCTDLKEGLPPPVASGAQVHLDSWVDTSSSNFHGSFANRDIQSCLTCHGQDYNGGTSDVSCITCHNAKGANIHGRGWESKASANFHGKVIAMANWDMRPCQQCHGATYAGGKVPSSCRTCHTNGAGPENCATCHGSATSIAPPRDLSDGTSRTRRGVGAHQIHLTGSSIAVGMVCGDCHTVPAAAYQSGHIDATPNAEVAMSTALARTMTNKPGTPNYTSSLPTITPNPSYDENGIKCSNTYCHGNFKNGNTTFAPIWNDATGSQMACGTCHGDVSKPTLLERALPKTASVGGTHPTIPSGWTCANCHTGVVDANTRIIDPTKHINGKLTIGGQEIDY
jgi:predicted CxxxxCH...CXXCH cytochrome family protein